MSKKFRVVIDFDFKNKKKFEYDFKFINLERPGAEINILDLTEYLRQVVNSLEKRYTGSGSDDKFEDNFKFH